MAYAFRFLAMAEYSIGKCNILIVHYMNRILDHLRKQKPAGQPHKHPPESFRFLF